MAASDYGYYRSDGIQSSGTALRTNGNAYIYNSAGQIYPRQSTETSSYSDGSWGGFSLYTIRQNDSWKSGAKQGYYYASGSNPHFPYGYTREQKGHFFFNGGKPDVKSVPAGKTLLGLTVIYAKFTFDRTYQVGAYAQTVTGVMRQSNYSIDDVNNGDFDGADVSGAEFTFDYLPCGEITEVEGAEGSALCNFIQSFLMNDAKNSLCLYNGEDSLASGWGCSAEYAGGENFTLEFQIRRIIQE